MKKVLQEMSGVSFGESVECGHAIHQPSDSESLNAGRGARDLSRRNTGATVPRQENSRTFRSPTFLRTKVRARFARAATTQNTYSARRLPERTGRSRPPSESFQTVRILCLLLLLGTIVHGQEIPADRVSVPFRDPARPGAVKVNLMTGGITVKGYDGKEVVVEARFRGGKSSNKEKSDTKAGDLKRIEIATPGLTVEEEDNVVNVSTAPSGHTVDVSLQVPTSTSLKLGCMNEGGILVEKVTGEIEANNLNGSVILTNVSGVVVAHSLNGEVRAQMDQVTPDKPMSFSTLNGDIDVTLPADLKAKVKLETQNGAIYSDFEIGLDKNPRPPTVEDGRKDGGKWRIVFDKGVVGTINGGGPEIQFKTVNGHIHIRKGTR